MLVVKWRLSVQKTELERAMTLRFGNDETLDQHSGQNRRGHCRCVSTWWLEEHHSCCQRNYLGCHIHWVVVICSLKKPGVRAGVTSKQSSHLLPPLTNFGLQGHTIPAEIQPRISSDECAICRAICDNTKSSQKHSWIASTSHRMPPEKDNVDSESQHSTDEPGRDIRDEARDYWESRGGRRVRGHGIARRTLFDPTHDEHPTLSVPH